MKRILIVEDDAAIRTELMTLLRTNGYAPVEDAPWDLILMDVNLPQLPAAASPAAGSCGRPPTPRSSS